MISAFLNTVKIPELRRRILFTLAIIVIVRLGAAITTPGVNQAVLSEWFRSTADKAGGGAALFNLFSGGGPGEFAGFFLGVIPFNNAVLMVLFLTAGHFPLCADRRSGGKDEDLGLRLGVRLARE